LDFVWIVSVNFFRNAYIVLWFTIFFLNTIMIQSSLNFLTRSKFVQRLKIGIGILSRVHLPAGHQGQRLRSGRLTFVHGSLETLLTQTIFDLRYANISTFFPLTDTRLVYFCLSVIQLAGPGNCRTLCCK